MKSGDRIGSYEIVDRIASGGMGMVYRGRHTALGGKPVAIKVLLPNLMDNPRVRKRFTDEAYIQAQLTHPHIVEVSDAIQTEDAHALVMELVEGGSLADYLEAHPGPMTEEDFLRLFVPVVEALAYAHGRELVHRDIKPENILLTPDGVPKVTDFGIAKMAEINAAYDLLLKGQ